MKLGQGCRRHMPWWCWFALACGALTTLPGAAHIAGAEDPLKTADHPKLPTGVSARPGFRLPAMPRQEPLVTQAYHVTSAIDKAQEEFDVNRDVAQAVVEGHLCGGTAALRAASHTSTPMPDSPAIAWSGEKLIIRQTAARHRQISMAMDVVQEHGFGWVRVEAKIVTGPVESITSMEFDWTIMQPDIPDNQRVPLRHHPANLASDFFPSLSQANQDESMEDRTSVPRIRTRSTVEKQMPTMIELMDAKRAAKVLSQLKEVREVNVLSAPKITTFNGQTATITDCCQRPFVVGVAKGQPQIRVVNDGVIMQMRPVRREDGAVWLDYVLTLSDIRSVEVVTIPAGKGRPEVSLQVPEVAETCLETSVNIAPGKTLVLGGLRTNDSDGNEVAMLVFLRAEGFLPPIDSLVARVSSARKRR